MVMSVAIAGMTTLARTFRFEIIESPVKIIS